MRILLPLVAVFLLGTALGGENQNENTTPRVELQSGITITPQPALVQQTMTFSASATGVGTLTYTWFIGGLELTGASVQAFYFEPGAYFARLVVSDSNGDSLEQFFRVYVTDASFDDDLDGVPTQLENELGSNPNDASSKTVDAIVDRLVYSTKPLKIKGDPNKVGRDFIKGTFSFDRRSDVPPATMSFMIRNVIKTFDITTSGKRLIASPRSGSKDDRLKLKIKNGVLIAGYSFKKGQFLQDINSGALTDINGKRVINIFVTVDAEMYGTNIDLSVKTAKSGKLLATGPKESFIQLK